MYGSGNPLSSWYGESPNYIIIKIDLISLIQLMKIELSLDFVFSCHGYLLGPVFSLVWE